jgi:hypothetical protein
MQSCSTMGSRIATVDRISLDVGRRAPWLVVECTYALE